MLTIFGAIAVSIMAGAYCLEDRSRWYTLLFSGASLATAIYTGLAGVYPIMVIEAIWSLIALRRFMTRAPRTQPTPLGERAQRSDPAAMPAPGRDQAAG